ncbi:hypothetical protein LP422_22680 [Janibacter limosus]|nr:hypothetical protein LP422_22680 [Janibacter limosus]
MWPGVRTTLRRCGRGAHDLKEMWPGVRTTLRRCGRGCARP